MDLPQKLTRKELYDLVWSEPLTALAKGRHGNWRMTFEFENGDVCVVDYEDYH